MSDKARLRLMISENTALPVSLIIVICGIVAYVVTGFSAGLALRERVEKVELKQDKYIETVTNIDNRLNRIEGALGVPKDGK